MKALAFDTETALIRPGLLVPPLTCVSWQREGQEAGIVSHLDALPRVRSWLADQSTILVGHNLAYDMAVLCAEYPEITPLVFAAYRAGRATCTKRRQQLIDIADGCFRGRHLPDGTWHVHQYSLDALSRRLLGIPVVKDTWRLRYAQFRGVPLRQWPALAATVQKQARERLKTPVEKAEHASLTALIVGPPESVLEYPLDDARRTLQVHQVQEARANVLDDQYRQAYADFSLHLCSAWGLRTDPDGVTELRSELESERAELLSQLETHGLVRVDGSRDTHAAMRAMSEACTRAGLAPVRTDTGQISLSADACSRVADECSIIAAYSEYTTIGKMLSSDVPMLEQGVHSTIHPRYDLAETGRTTCSGPNIQNLNTGRIRDARSAAQALRPRVRQAFRPRDGYVYAQCDYPQLELYTLAQTCISWLGHSALGDALRRGVDPHLVVAAQIPGIPYDEAAKNKKRKDVDYSRQVGKFLNFGKPGGMGAAKLVQIARLAYGMILTVEQVTQYTDTWYRSFPEMREHFARVNRLLAGGETTTIESLFTRRVRGGARYCAACNNGFQGLGADCAKAALCLVAEAEYADRKSPLYGSRTVAFIHDEIIVETPDIPTAHDAATELARLMVLGANRYLPDVPIPIDKMEPLLMRVWSKNAVPTRVNDRLVPWEMP